MQLVNTVRGTQGTAQNALTVDMDYTKEAMTSSNANVKQQSMCLSSP